MNASRPPVGVDIRNVALSFGLCLLGVWLGHALALPLQTLRRP